MTLGTLHDPGEVTLGDTNSLRPYLYYDNEQPVPLIDLTGVSFTIKKPDGTSTTVPGALESDGSGFLLYDDTDQEGLYLWVAQFTFVSGQKRSYHDEFNVSDPMGDPLPLTEDQKIGQVVWQRLEDCFDSEEGGPWLRDMTLAFFDPSKMERFIAEALLEINVYPPTTNLTLDFFTVEVINGDPVLPIGTLMPNPDRYVIALGTELAVIRHLMRSYVEQPAPQGANIVYQDRRDYLQRWQTIYALEEAEYRRLIALWKRQFFNFGRSALLVHSKAGRLGFAPGFRTRNASRGYT